MFPTIECTNERHSFRSSLPFILNFPIHPETMMNTWLTLFILTCKELVHGDTGDPTWTRVAVPRNNAGFFKKDWHAEIFFDTALKVPNNSSGSDTAGCRELERDLLHCYSSVTGIFFLCGFSFRVVYSLLIIYIFVF